MPKPTRRANARTLPEARPSSRRSMKGKRASDLTDEEIAAVDFDSLPRRDLERLKPPSRESWLTHLVSIHVALALMGKSKDQIKQMFVGLRDTDITEGVDGLNMTRKFLQAVVEVMTAAELRYLYAAASFEINKVEDA